MWSRRQLVIAVVLFGLTALGLGFTLANGFSNLPKDNASAIQSTVAWIVEGRPLPGWDTPCFDTELMKTKSGFLVFCDVVADDIPVSFDPRVKRVTREEFRRRMDKHGFDGTAYLTIRFVTETDSQLVIDVSCSYGNAGAFSYKITFSKTRRGLKPTCQPGPVA